MIVVLLYKKNIYQDVDDIQNKLDDNINITKQIELIFIFLIEEKKNILKKTMKQKNY